MENLPIGLDADYQWVDIDGEGISGVLAGKAGAMYGIARFDRIGLMAVRRLELWRSLSEPWLDRNEARPDLPGLVARFAAGSFAGAAPRAGPFPFYVLTNSRVAVNSAEDRVLGHQKERSGCYGPTNS